MLHRFITIFLCFVFALGSFAQTPNLANKPDLTGDALAEWQYQTARHYEKGTGGVRVNLNEAFEWYKKSADLGYALAQAAVAYFYENGLGGVKQNLTQAFFYYKKAAEQGLASAQFHVGLYHELGRGVAKDFCLAKEWYAKAKDNNYKRAETRLDNVKKKCPGPDTIPVPEPVPVPVPVPCLKVNNYKFSGEETLEKIQQFDLTLYLENKGDADAEDVVVDIVLPEKSLLLEENKSISFKTIKRNETKTIGYKIIILGSYTANTLTISVNVKEKTGKHAENWHKELTLGDPFPNESDVDKDIPETDIRLKNTFAFIVAEENYKYVDPVTYAINDASIFREYCKRTLGIPVENIKLEKDVTKGELLRSLGKLKKLVNEVNQSEDVKIIFYYAGHGIPGHKKTLNEEGDTASAFLLLNDGEANDQENGCVSLQQLYEELGSIKAQSVCVFLDACFSGAKRGGGMLNSARGVVTVDFDEDIPQNMIVLSAAESDETAFPFKEKIHGLFTYYLLKKLKDTSGNVTYGELSQYIRNEVVRKSLQINNKQQTPSAISEIDGWEEMKLR